MAVKYYTLEFKELKKNVEHPTQCFIFTVFRYNILDMLG